MSVACLTWCLMSSQARKRLLTIVLLMALGLSGGAQGPIADAEVLDTMKRATRFMVETVSTDGGYVWAYCPTDRVGGARWKRARP